MTPGRPKPSPQNDGIAGWTLRCVDNGAVMTTARHSADRVRLKAIAIRRETGVTSRGITYGEAADAVQNLSGVTLLPMHLESRLELRNLLASGRGACISIDTNETYRTARATNQFRGHHTVYGQHADLVPNGGCRCEAKIATQHWEGAVEDPGTTYAGYLWWSMDLLYRAAERRTGNNGINVLAGSDTEGVRWKVAEKGRYRKEPSVHSTDLGPLPVGKVLRGGRTENGGDWRRKDRTIGTIWVHVQRPDGRWAWTTGRKLRHA